MRTYYIWQEKQGLNISEVKPHTEHSVTYQGDRTVQWLKDTIGNYERAQEILRSLVDEEMLDRWDNEGGT